MMQPLMPIAIALVLAAADATRAESQLPGSNTVHGEVRLVDRRGRALQDRSDVVAFIDGLATARPPAGAPKMSHKGLRFAPSVLPIVRGQQVDFLNDDDVYHNVFSLSKAKSFDLGIYPQGASRRVRFEQPGLVKIYCNIHPDMVSNVLVLNNDRFAKTDARGRYEIRNIPDGKYRLRFWHESNTEIEQLIDLRGGARLVLSVEMVARQVPVRHANKFGKPYDKKY